MNTRVSSFPSVPAVIQEKVESEKIPFFNSSFFSSCLFLFAHFTIRLRDLFPARKPRTSHCVSDILDMTLFPFLFLLLFAVI